MSKRRGKERAARKEFEDEMERLAGEITATMFPVICSGDDCEKRTSFLLPGEGPYGGGTFSQKGWTVVVEEDPGGVLFLCADCFKKESEGGAVHEG